MREVRKYRYFFAAVLTVIIFLLGVFFSNFVDDTRYSSLRNEINQDNVELESRQLQLNYLQSDNVKSCGALKAGLRDIVQGYNNRLSNLQNYQERSFFKQEEFGTMKQSYILSGIRYWMFAQELRQECDYNADTVLFFTEGIGDNQDCPDCGSMGEKLTILKRKYGESLLVFTVPTNIEDGMVDMLEGQYNITERPTIIINGNESQKIEGLRSRNYLERQLTVSGGEN